MATPKCEPWLARSLRQRSRSMRSYWSRSSAASAIVFSVMHGIIQSLAHFFFSLGGVAMAHWVSSATGKKAIEGDHKTRQIAYVERQVKKYGGLAIAVAALAPP